MWVRKVVREIVQYIAVFTAHIIHIYPFFQALINWPRNKSTSGWIPKRISPHPIQTVSRDLAQLRGRGIWGNLHVWVHKNLDFIYCIGGNRGMDLICFNQHHISWTELRISSKASTVFLEKMVENPYIVLRFLSENVGTTQIHCLHHHFPVERC